MTHLLKRGFTLVEVNLAVFIMAGGILAMISLYSLGYRENRQSREDVAAAALADDVICIKLCGLAGKDLGKIHVALARYLVDHADRDILSRFFVLLICVDVYAEHIGELFLRVSAGIAQTRYSFRYFPDLINHMKISSFSKKRFFTLLQ